MFKKPRILTNFKGYTKQDFMHDLLAGLLVAIIALPLSIALGIQSGATLQQGIITAIVAGFLISALGGSNFQIGGPTAAFVVILLGYIGTTGIGYLGLAIATIFAGVILILLSIFKVGGLVKYIPYPIVIGFTTGIGITLFVGQLKDFLGITVTGSTETFIEKIVSYGSALGTTNIAALIMGACSVAMIMLLPKLNKKLPAAFITCIVMTLISLLINNYTTATIPTIGSVYGEVEATFSFISFADIGSVQFTSLIMPAIVIAFLCAVESLLSCTVADGMTGTKHDSNQELFGQGVANICSAVAGGLPATGAIARTAANINNGAKTSFSGMFHALFLLLMYIVLMPAMQLVPLTTLASVLMVVSLNMSNFKLFGRLTKFTIKDTIILLATCILTILFDLTYGVIGGMLLTLLMQAMALKQGIKLSTEGTVITVKGNINFVSVQKILKEINNIQINCNEITLDFGGVVSLDATSAERLSKMTAELKHLEKTLVFINTNEKQSALLEKAKHCSH